MGVEDSKTPWKAIVYCLHPDGSLKTISLSQGIRSSKVDFKGASGNLRHNFRLCLQSFRMSKRYPYNLDIMATSNIDSVAII